MNKYRRSPEKNAVEAALHSFERGELEMARMHKPGYRRKMRRTNNKHIKKAKYTSH